MGKHNGKSRSQGGTKVGAALARRNKAHRAGGDHADRHTTDIAGNMQSVLDRSDLDELMAMADLAGRDFTAERHQPVVISLGAVDPIAAEKSAAERAVAEARHQRKLAIPRRPAWDASTTPDQLEAQEKDAFLSWRRALAHLEEEEGLLLTPFERNLEVWRQLWRVVERSDVIVQVVDARDPLLYYSPDLAAYAAEVHPTKTSLVLLNKADLLPAACRAAWADYFDKQGIPYAFWSAAAASDLQQRARQEAALTGAPQEQLQQQLLTQQRQLARAAATAAAPAAADGPAAAAAAGVADDERITVLGVEELLEWMEQQARASISSSALDDPRRSDLSRRFMVGLVGYPNVGKSSTINAIFGSKKTAVAPTPGKTKHFQTLNVSPTVCLCDCPGLVFPRFAASKADMVAAGVVPIDRLTDVRGPVEVVAARCGRRQLEAVYGLRGSGSSSSAPATASSSSGSDAGPGPSSSGSSIGPPLRAGQLLLALAVARGWAQGAGLPDEARAGRQILKDYTAGKLLYCRLPPGWPQKGFAPNVAPTAAVLEGMPLQSEAAAAAPSSSSSHSRPAEEAAAADEVGARGGAEEEEDEGSDEEGAGSDAAGPSTGTAAAAVAAGMGPGSLPSSQGQQAGIEAAEADEEGLALDLADLELMEEMGLETGKQKARRAEHKFHKKAARSKGTRGLERDAGGYDGAQMLTGKKGGLVRVGGY